jgi:hypothetical protein
MRNIPFSKSSKLSDFEPDDIGGAGDGYGEMIDMSGEQDYKPESFDPLKNKQDKYIGADIEKILPGGKVNRSGSITPGPNPSPTQYGRSAITNKGKINYSKLDEIPFESEQLKALGAELADENALESLIDAEIDKLDIAMRKGDTPEIMLAEGKIKNYQGMLSEAMATTQSKRDTFGVSYETEALKARIQQASKGKINEMDLELAAEDVKPSPNTPKGKGPGIKGAYAKIEQQLDAEKKLPKSKLSGGEYSQSKSSYEKINLEKELNQPTGIDKAKIDNTSVTSGSVKDVVDAGPIGPSNVGKKPDIKTMTGVDSKGNILPGKSPGNINTNYFRQEYLAAKSIQEAEADFNKAVVAPDVAGPTSTGVSVQQRNIELARKRIAERREQVPKKEAVLDFESTNPEKQIARQDMPDGGKGLTNQEARIAERRGQKPIGKFQGKKTSGNVISSVTPDAPKQVVSQPATTESKSYLESYNKAIAEGATPRSAKKVADQLERLNKVRGRGKGKGKLLTTLGAVGIASIIEKNK